MFYVYKIANKLNGKVYIGKATDLEARWSAHLLAAEHPEKEKHYLIHRAIAKYGEDNFSFEKLEEFESEQNALDKEKFLISLHKSNVSRYGPDFGYNLTDGGEGTSGHRHTEETKRIMSQKKQGVYDGDKNPCWGKVFSDSEKALISANRKGKAQGSSNPNAKLTEVDAVVIKQLIADGKNNSEIGRLFNVRRELIRQIRIGNIWRHVSTKLSQSP